MNKSLLILNEIVERVNNNKETILDKPKFDKVVSNEQQDIIWNILRKSGYSVMFEESKIIIRKEHHNETKKAISEGLCQYIQRTWTN